MGAGCCKADSNSVVSPNSNRKNPECDNNNNNDSPARFSNLNNMTTNQNSVQTTSLTYSSSMNASSTSSFLDAAASLALKEAMRFAKPCSEYFRGLEGIFYCVGDQECPVLQANPSEEIWGGGAPSKQMISICEKEIAYASIMQNEQETSPSPCHQSEGKSSPTNSSDNQNKVLVLHKRESSNNSGESQMLILQKGSTPVKLQEMMEFPKIIEAEKSEKKSENDDVDTDVILMTQTLSPRNGDINQQQQQQKQKTAERLLDDEESSTTTTSTTNKKDPETEQRQQQHLRQFQLQQQQYFSALKKSRPDPVESKIYTADSPPCRCARHAGAIGRSGGVFIVLTRPGEYQYQGFVRNGCVSHSHGSYDLSIEICSLQFPK